MSGESICQHFFEKIFRWLIISQKSTVVKCKKEKGEIYGNQIKKCPFCGGDASIENATAYLDKAKIVKCGHCHCRTALVLIDHPRLTANGLDESTRYTVAQAEQKAAELWNARATVND